MVRIDAGRRAREAGMHHQYAVAFFDILGFKKKFETRGLSDIEDRYLSLIATVDRFNANTASLFGDLSFKESAYWTCDGDIFILNQIAGAYASDSIVVWAPAVWPEARGKTEEERDALAQDPAQGWLYTTIPCDNLLNVCNELICRSIEVGLPFRGALAMGPALLDRQRSIFIGEPLIEAATLERGQTVIGASLCASFARQTIPQRFLLPLDAHLKKDFLKDYGGAVLDWPRHWRRTRTEDLGGAIDALSRNAGTASRYYENTRALIDLSEQYRDRFEAPDDLLIRATYPAYANPRLATHFRAIRRR
ncbi:hypothetical protein ACFOLC_11805 [Lysobacter cavernae]|uniref:Guanylate cyclase domain-containing protein n=1 Tax=Lysobacter cavernae TaxID=1685901 RepID=A0ABV7RSE7_9GAMM